MRKDYYAILGVARTASVDEIRAAFRRLAKRRHPDKNPRDDTARDHFERIVRAYRALSDFQKRKEYDRQSRPHTHYRPAQPKTPEDLGYEMFDLLLAEEQTEALDAFNRFLDWIGGSVATLDLPKYLDYGDARDCEFLLAEALERHHRTAAAISLYELALEREQRRPYFRKFTVEIRDRLRRLYLSQLKRRVLGEDGWKLSPQEALEPVFRLGATKRQRAGYYKKLAEMLCEAGHDEPARVALAGALRIAPKLGGVKKLCERLDITPPSAETTITASP